MYKAPEWLGESPYKDLTERLRSVIWRRKHLIGIPKGYEDSLGSYFADIFDAAEQELKLKLKNVMPILIHQIIE